MAKEKNAGAVELIGSPEKLIKLFIKDKADSEWGFNKITMEGPPHKQLQHTLVLTRLEKLLAIYRKSYGITLQSVEGLDVNSVGPEHEVLLPVQLPAQSIASLKNADEMIDKMSKGPEHELLYTLLLLQVIEALIAAEK